VFGRFLMKRNLFIFLQMHCILYLHHRLDWTCRSRHVPLIIAPTIFFSSKPLHFLFALHYPLQACFSLIYIFCAGLMINSNLHCFNKRTWPGSTTVCIQAIFDSNCCSRDWFQLVQFKLDFPQTYLFRSYALLSLTYR